MIVCPVIAYITVDDEIVLYCDLDIVCRLQLPVLHVVFFHPHKRCLQIGLGIAVPVFPHDLKAFLILHQAPAAFFQILVKFLDLRLMLSSSENGSDPFPFCDTDQALLQFQNLKSGTVINLDLGIAGELFMLFYLPFPVSSITFRPLSIPSITNIWASPGSYLGP